MLQRESILTIIDNTVAVTVKCISGRKVQNKLGDIIIASIQTLKMRTSTKKKVRLLKKGQIVTVLILTTRAPHRRQKSIQVCSKLNTGCLINKDFTPIGSRLRGVLFREISAIQQFKKLQSISEFIF